MAEKTSGAACVLLRWYGMAQSAVVHIFDLPSMGVKSKAEISWRQTPQQDEKEGVFIFIFSIDTCVKQSLSHFHYYKHITF